MTRLYPAQDEPGHVDHHRDDDTSTFSMAANDTATRNASRAHARGYDHNSPHQPKQESLLIGANRTSHGETKDSTRDDRHNARAGDDCTDLCSSSDEESQDITYSHRHGLSPSCSMSARAPPRQPRPHQTQHPPHNCPPPPRRRCCWIAAVTGAVRPTSRHTPPAHGLVRPSTIAS